jgi:serine O-acetyltransferase
MLNALQEDFAVNRDWLSRVVLSVYRFGRWSTKRAGMSRLVGLTLYRLLNNTVLRLLVGIDLPVQAVVGPGLRLFHGGRGVAIHKSATIGRDVTIYQNVAIGTWNRDDEVPTIGNGVTIGVGAAILGPISVGDGARIAAHALVRTDVPAGGSAQSPIADIFEPRRR